jgi:hypothetical protein
MQVETLTIILEKSNAMIQLKRLDNRIKPCTIWFDFCPAISKAVIVRKHMYNVKVLIKAVVHKDV